ncbi:MAG: 16S rRNA (uracil(1498)-N(3))-methyltransferase [Clostridia bacterium]|nr:16S rRNA (uracil(1498)-N(3))-methyltransferase [Clostridia bacterium]
MDNRFYISNITNNKAVFTGQEANHIAKVRRCKVGDEIVAFNGDGLNYFLRITSILKDTVEAEILKTEQNKSFAGNTTVYLAMLKNDAMVTAIDHLAEMNVKHVKLFKSDFSVADFDNKKLEKLKNVCIQASKQCERADVMDVSIIKAGEVATDIMQFENKFFAYEDSTTKIEKFCGDFAVIIGPEGGFSKPEVEKFSKVAKNVSLGNTILRAEVACVAAVAELKAVQYEG